MIISKKGELMSSTAYDLSFYEFDENNDPENYGVLLCDLVHGTPPLKPLYIGVGWYWYYHGFRYGAETLQLPTTFGWDSRFINGYPYITAIRTTKDEARARMPAFREKIKPFIEDFEGIWNSKKLGLIAMYKEARETRGLSEWEDIRNLSNIDLLSFFLDFVNDINREEGETHMLMMTASYYINGLFQEMWHDIFHIEAPIDPNFNNLMMGFENQDIIVNRALWKLGRRAVELDLTTIFDESDDKAILEALKESKTGNKWLAEFKAFLNEHGWRCERMHSYDTPAWIESPELVLGRIKMLMTKEAFAFDEEKESRTEKRQAAEEEVLAKVPEHRRDGFDMLMRAAQKSGYWSEDHTYFCDFYVGAMGHWIASEYGRRFSEAGAIELAEDIHFLHPNEIRKAAIPMGRVDLRPYVERRKKEWEKNLTIEPKPFYGDIEQAQAVLQSDPTLSVSSQVPIVRKELKADFYGAASAPGVIEGNARVILTVADLDQIKPGEILVAPGISAAWTVVFSLISGLVSDGGGALSHPLIMAREHGIPAVVGCVDATKKIETGQRIRVNGDLGVVYILDGDVDE